MRSTSQLLGLAGPRWMGALGITLALVLAPSAGCSRLPAADGVRPDPTFPVRDGAAGDANLPGQGSDGRDVGHEADGSTGPVDAPDPDPPDPTPYPPPPTDANPGEDAGPRPPDGGIVDVPSAPPDVAPAPPPPPAPGPPDLSRGRIAHWRLDETLGKVAGDTCGIGNHGIITGVIDSDWQAGRVNNSLLFSRGRRSVIEVKAHETLRPSAMLSISIWVRAQGWTLRPRLVQKGEVDEQFGLGVEAGLLRFSVKLVDGHLAVVTAAPPALNQWVHIAAVFDGWKAQLFVGGNLVGTTNILGYPMPTDKGLTIGGRPPGAPEADHFSGSMDDVILYNRPLTPEEIRLLASGKTG